MRALVAIVLALSCAAATGCGKKDTADNSHIQSPNDQPLGTPQPIGGGAKPGQGAVLQPNNKGPGKPLPTVEIKP